VLIITSAYNRPDFIELQHKAFQEFLQEPFSFIVFNDAPTDLLRSQINDQCKQLGIMSITVPSSIHSAPFPKRYIGERLTLETRGIQSMQYALQEVGLHYNGIVMLVDSDIFLVRPFSVKEFLNQHHIAGLPIQKESVQHLWSGLVFIDMVHAPNKDSLSFYPGRIGNTVVNAGGFSHHYLQKSQVRFKPFDTIISANMPLCTEQSCKSSNSVCEHDMQLFKAAGFDNNQIEFMSHRPSNVEFMCNNRFLHYRGGSNWDARSESYRAKKTAVVNAYITSILFH